MKVYPKAVDLLQHWFFILPFAGDWNYENPETWNLTHPQCGGERQSPIALYTKEAIYNPFIRLHFLNYAKPLDPPVEIINNGYSVEVGARINFDTSIPFLTISSVIFGTFFGWYEVQGIHFHWGSNGVLGSEHTINGKQYDLEMHIVHKNDKYPTIDEARNNPDGFIVLGVLFKETETTPDASHRTFKEIYKALNSISQYNSTAELHGPITMKSFLPGLDTSKYIAYKGSLTTPPCSESVLWFVFVEILPVSSEDLKAFWNLLDEHGHPILNNYRPIQRTNVSTYRRTKLDDV